MLIISVYSFAQLTVTTDGKVGIMTTPSSSSIKLSVGASPDFNYNVPYHIGIYSKPSFSISSCSFGLISDATTEISNSSSLSVGVLGRAGNSFGNLNFGVAGALVGTKGGAGVFGTVGNWTYNSSNRYAGYFYGDVSVYGALKAEDIRTSSDMRLKTNVEYLSETGNALENILKMNTFSYNYRYHDSNDNEEDSSQDSLSEVEKELSSIRHFGLSAQELLTIYPNLVRQDADGYYSINYLELVPVLIQAIQEQKEEMDELKNEISEMKGSESIRKSPTHTDLSFTTTADNILYQNEPNPFKGQTVIRFHLADNVQEASICIFDLQGKMLKEVSILKGMKQISINSYELGKGMLLYSLIVNGQEIDTKKMIIK